MNGQSSEQGQDEIYLILKKNLNVLPAKLILKADKNQNIPYTSKLLMVYGTEGVLLCTGLPVYSFYNWTDNYVFEERNYFKTSSFMIKIQTTSYPISYWVCRWVFKNTTSP